MTRPAWILTFAIITLIVLHQDNWFWNDGTLVMGIMPVGLFYHACISLAATVVWYLATVYCWPRDLDSETSDGQGDAT